MLDIGKNEMTTLCALMILYPGFVYIHPEHVVHTSKTLHPIIMRMELVVLSEDTDVWKLVLVWILNSM